MKSLLIALLFAFPLTASAKPSLTLSETSPAWAQEALRMTGESDKIREQALERLRRTPQLEKNLRQALQGPYRGLALDTISALGLHSMIPDLMRTAPDDPSGFTYLTLNNLMSSKNLQTFVKFYKKQLLCKFHCRISGPSQIVIIETLARLDQDIPAEDLENLFNETKWPEVQSAILYYIRLALLKYDKEVYAQLLKSAFRSEVLQIREQAQFLLSELPQPLRTRLEKSDVNLPTGDLHFNKDSSPHVHILFGYKDVRPARFVADRYERLSLIQKLTDPCTTNQDLMCDFKRDKQDLNILVKRIRTREGESQLLRLHISASSAGPDDDDNRKNPYQNHLSKNTQKQFREGLRHSELVFYIGHSRDGGGPDFSPPRLTASLHIDYNWYRKHQPGLKWLLKQLRPRKKKRSPFTLGLLSCASTQHFTKPIQGASKSVHLVTVPELIYYADALLLLEEEISRFVREKFNDYGRKN